LFSSFWGGRRGWGFELGFVLTKQVVCNLSHTSGPIMVSYKFFNSETSMLVGKKTFKIIYNENEI
jgi:hypothetical protein